MNKSAHIYGVDIDGIYQLIEDYEDTIDVLKISKGNHDEEISQLQQVIKDLKKLIG